MLRITGTDGAGGLESLAADIEREAEIAPDEAHAVVKKGSLNIKKDWQRRWSGISHAPMLPYTIGYESRLNGSRAGATIGPDDAKQVGGGPHRTPGNLAAIFEYGSVNNAPIPGGAPALEAEKPRFEKAMEDLVMRGDSWR